MNDSEIKLVLEKEINAPVETVFDAWTKPELIKRWFAPGSVMRVENAEVDRQVGGSYLIHMHDPEEKADYIVSGTYEEIVENEKLVFNWKWKDGVDRTQVTVEFSAAEDDKTTVKLTHKGFSQQEFADKHNQGWNGCLANLEQFSTELA